MEIGILIVFVIVMYFLPYGIARHRKKKNAEAIGWLNFFLGWTVIGWLIALTWALTSDGSSLPAPVFADSVMKKCPFCAEQIKADAIKCRFCGSDLSTHEKPTAPQPMDSTIYRSSHAEIVKPQVDVPAPDVDDRLWHWVVIALLAVVFFALVGAFFSTTGLKDAQKADKEIKSNPSASQTTNTSTTAEYRQNKQGG